MINKIYLTSFGYRYGLPEKPLDAIISAIKLPNPFHIYQFRNMNGKNDKVKDFVIRSEEGQRFVQRAYNFIISHKDRVYINIAVGCVGGKHRSVAVIEELAELLKKNEYLVSVFHRDIGKNE